MKYNYRYLDVKYSLMSAFMIKASKDILDVSYSITESLIDIQVILLNGAIISDDVQNKINSSLSDFEIRMHTIYISKEKFNENKGEWKPKYYDWLEDLLFSKAEVL
ncbi:MAG TPA: hypothetical protein VK616_13485 [Flavitalea sp.]|nr:hypothetical protein [Flavitalea sp.]HTF31623.1 hypothetical protein [Flavitalea sp.]